MRNTTSSGPYHRYETNQFAQRVNFLEQRIISRPRDNNKLIVDQINQQGDQYLQYIHVLEMYQPYNLANLPQIAKSLGINGFATQDKFINLYKKFNQSQFGKVCKLCLQIRVQGLLLNFNQQSKILRQICITKFPNLHTLDLSGNKIESLQYLSTSYMPNLMFVNLSANHITNLRPLRRLCLQSLNTLDLTSNFYLQIPDMMPGIDIQFDRRVIQKALIYKVVVTRPSVRLLRSGLRMMDYFR